jgi:hypothetical protein
VLLSVKQSNEFLPDYVAVFSSRSTQSNVLASMTGLFPMGDWFATLLDGVTHPFQWKLDGARAQFFEIDARDRAES